MPDNASMYYILGTRQQSTQQGQITSKFAIRISKYCGTVGYNSPSNSKHSKKTRVYMRRIYCSGFHLLVIIKVNQFKDGGHRHLNPGGVGR